jgi:hypothetical protein
MSDTTMPTETDARSDDRVPHVDPNTQRYTHVGYLWGIEYLGIGRYATPSQAHTRPVVLCHDCGSVVFHRTAHDEWHGMIAK